MDQTKPRRKNIRLKNYDYSTPAAYFITICTNQKLPILSKIYLENEYPLIELTPVGEMVRAYLKSMPELLEYVIMPNHIHLIVLLEESQEQNRKKQLGQVIRSFKGLTSKEAGYSLWQRNYYDHVIRNEKDMLGRIKYIEKNPFRWVYDKYYTQ